MILRRSLASVAIVLSMSSAALACGKPDSITLARAFLSFAYPEALHVTGATWEAQKDGILPMPDRERLVATGTTLEAMIAKAHFLMIDSLTEFGWAFNHAAVSEHRIAIVLLDKMHWARFEPDPFAPDPESRFNSAAKSAQGDDLVVVTKEITLHAIRTGDLTFAEAERMGLVRLYGESDQIEAFRADFGALGATRLASQSRAGSLLTRARRASSGTPSDNQSEADATQ